MTSILHPIGSTIPQIKKYTSPTVNDFISALLAVHFPKSSALAGGHKLPNVLTLIEAYFWALSIAWYPKTKKL
jgi:hypothetical protein